MSSDQVIQLPAPVPRSISLSASNGSHPHELVSDQASSSAHSPMGDHGEGSISQFRGHLPNEILSFIISFADQSTLGNLMSVCKNTYRLVAPTLYSHITITECNADKLFLGLPRSTKYRKIKVSSMNSLTSSNEEMNGPIKLLWPDVPMESEDEEEIAQPDTTSIPYAYPTSLSEKRKLALFEFTRIITLTTRMPTQLCHDLRGWTRRESIKHKSHLFPKFETLIITGKCLKDCANWYDRHLISPDDIVDDQFFGVLPLSGRCKNLCITSPTYDEADYDDYILRRSKSDAHLLFSPAFKLMCSERFKKLVSSVTPDLIVNMTRWLTTLREPPKVTLHNIFSYALPLCEVNHTLFLAPYSRTDQPKTLHERCPRVNKTTRTSQMQDLNDAIGFFGEYDFDKIIVGVPDAEMEDIDWDKIFGKSRGMTEGILVDVQMISQLPPCPCCFTKEGIQ
ncbi:hypothetical protein V866_000908 [Kwoniella sp. B9012]